MNKFINSLISDDKNIFLPEEYNFFGRLIGSWQIDYINTRTSEIIKGEWHFSWILDGMAIQDVIYLPAFEYGTTIRIYNPVSHAWDISYCYTGNIIRLEARRQNDKIVLTDIDNERRKWVFIRIEDDKFHWQDVTVKDDGDWQINYEIFAERTRS